MRNGNATRWCGLTPCGPPHNTSTDHVHHPPLSDAEFTRRGNALFERHVRPNVDVDTGSHKFVAIDVETGAYAMHEDEREATKHSSTLNPKQRGEFGSVA